MEKEITLKDIYLGTAGCADGKRHEREMMKNGKGSRKIQLSFLFVQK